jgi:hypothetical protein
MKRFLIISLMVCFTAMLASQAHCQSAKEAMKALKKMGVRVEVGVSYQDYSPLISDCKVEVDSFLESRAAKKSPEAALHIKKAIDYYLLAKRLWDIKFEFSPPLDLIAVDSPGGGFVRKIYPEAKSSKIPPQENLRDPLSYYFIPEILNDIWVKASKEAAKAALLMD